MQEFQSSNLIFCFYFFDKWSTVFGNEMKIDRKITDRNEQNWKKKHQIYHEVYERSEAICSIETMKVI